MHVVGMHTSVSRLKPGNCIRNKHMLVHGTRHILRRCAECNIDLHLSFEVEPCPMHVLVSSDRTFLPLTHCPSTSHTRPFNCMTLYTSPTQRQQFLLLSVPTCPKFACTTEHDLSLILPTITSLYEAKYIP